MSSHSLDYNSLSIEKTVRWLTIPQDRDQLLLVTRELIGEVRHSASLQLKLPKIEGSLELVAKLDEILYEIETQFDRIAETIRSSDLVHSGVVNLCRCVQNIHDFFKTLNNTKLLMFKKKSLKKQLALLNNDLRHRSTQITASLSLELLNSKHVKSHEKLSSPIPVVENKVDLESRFQKAFSHYLFAAERGHVKSMSRVADIYSNGLGLRADDTIALRWLMKAEELGCVVAKFKLGLFLINEIKNRVNSIEEDLTKNNMSVEDEVPLFPLSLPQPRQSLSSASEQEESLKREEKFLHAVDLITESAGKGHVEAQTTLGQLYELAEIYDIALQWYEHAAENGSLRATNLIGMLYYRGLGVPKLYETALRHFQAAARGGDPVACNNVAKCLEDGKGVERNIEKALDMYKLGADSGSGEAIYSYGYLTLKEALSQQIGAKNENNTSLLVLGKVGKQFYAVENNLKLKEGVRYLRMAVEYGVPDAAYQLGRLYEQGVCVPHDISSAYSHYLWAAELGHGKSSLCAANILYENIVSNGKALSLSGSDKRNMVFAAHLYRQAAQSDIVQGMNAYALLMEDGSGNELGQPLLYEAAKWFLAAAEAGLLEAAGNLGYLLAMNNHIEEICTVQGQYISTYDVRVWLESLVTSPQIPSDITFRNAIEKLKYSESKSGRIPQDENKKTVKRNNLQSKSSNQLKELHSSILFTQNSNSGAINILSKCYNDDYDGMSCYKATDELNQFDTKYLLPANKLEKNASSLTSSASHRDNYFHKFSDEKKISEIENNNFFVNSNLHSSAEEKNFVDRNGRELDEYYSLGTEVDNMSSPILPLRKASSLKASQRTNSPPKVRTPQSTKKKIVTISSVEVADEKETSTSTDSVSSAEKNKMRKKENLDRLKFKKSNYSMDDQ